MVCVISKMSAWNKQSQTIYHLQIVKLNINLLGWKWN